MPYLNTFDPATPADGDITSSGDDEIRKLKAALIERLQTFFTDINADPLALIAGIIGSPAIANLAILTAHLADLAVSTGKIADLAVTDAKIAALNGAKITDLTITAAKLVDLIITTSKLSDGAVTNPKLADLAVTGAKIALATILNTNIAADTLIRANHAPGARQEIVKQNFVDMPLAAFTLATDTATDTAAVALGGALITDIILVTPKGDTADAFTAAQKLMQFYAYCSAAGSVKMRFINTSGGPITMPAMTYRVMALRRWDDWP